MVNWCHEQDISLCGEQAILCGYMFVTLKDVSIYFSYIRVALTKQSQVIEFSESDNKVFFTKLWDFNDKQKYLNLHISEKIKWEKRAVKEIP